MTDKETIDEWSRSGKSMLSELVMAAKAGLELYPLHELDKESFEEWNRYMSCELFAHRKVVSAFRHEAGNAALTIRQTLTPIEIIALTAKLLPTNELKPFLINPKNKPFYRQFEGGKKWKF